MVNVYINYEKKFAFVEFRTGEHVRTVMCLTATQSADYADLTSLAEQHL